MKLQVFNGGLNVRADPHLIGIAEAVQLENIDISKGSLTPIKDKLETNLIVNEFAYYFTAEQHWVSSSINRDYLEYQNTLYYTQDATYPKKYKNGTEHRLGIIKPSLAPSIANIEEAPNAPTGVTLTQSTGGDIPAQLDNGAQRTLLYKFVNLSSLGLYSEVFETSIALTGSGTVEKVTINALVGGVGNTRIYRWGNGAYRYIGTLNATATTLDDDTFHLYGAARVEETINLIGLTGTYQYVTTYYNSSDGSESMPSALSSEEVSEGGLIEVANIIKSEDPQVDKIRLYRIGGDLTTFTLVVELANLSTTYIDKLSDTGVDGRLLDSTYNNEAPTGLKYLIESHGVLFGALGDKLYYTRTGQPNAWPSTNYIDFETDLVGLGVTANGVIAFTKFRSWVIIGTDPATFVRHPLGGDQGCVNHKSIQRIKGAILWVSLDGIVTTSGSETVVLSEDKLGKLNLDVVNAEVYDSVYYVHKTDLTTLVLDLRFTPTYYDLNLGVSRLVKAEDTFYGYTGGKLFSLFKSENNLALTYKSPELVEQEYTNLKTYKSIYVSSAGNLEINIYRDNKLIKTKNLSGVTTHEIKVPQTEQQGYTLQFDISGTGIVKEIAYNALGRQK